MAPRTDAASNHRVHDDVLPVPVGRDSFANALDDFCYFVAEDARIGEERLPAGKGV